MNVLFLVLFPLPFLALSYGLFRAGKSEIALGQASKKWPAITGSVQSITHVCVGDYGNSPGPDLKHQFYVRYFYDFGGKRYWGDWKSPAARLLRGRSRYPLRPRRRRSHYGLLQSTNSLPVSRRTRSYHRPSEVYHRRPYFSDCPSGHRLWGRIRLGQKVKDLIFLLVRIDYFAPNNVAIAALKSRMANGFER